MPAYLKSLITPTRLLIVLVLVLALGGTATAASLINGSKIKNGTITGAKLKNGTLTANKFAPGTIKGPQGTVGPTGPAGPTVTMLSQWMGNWSSAHGNYNKGDIVLYYNTDGQYDLYICTTMHTATATTPPYDTAHWQIFLPAGARGSSGSNGTNGAASTVPGPQGLQGPQGPMGARGATGPASVSQAYQAASSSTQVLPGGGASTTVATVTLTVASAYILEGSAILSVSPSVTAPVSVTCGVQLNGAAGGPTTTMSLGNAVGVAMSVPFATQGEAQPATTGNAALVCTNASATTPISVQAATLSAIAANQLN